MTKSMVRRALSYEYGLHKGVGLNVDIVSRIVARKGVADAKVNMIKPGLILVDLP